jgi:hypothetical protein
MYYTSSKVKFKATTKYFSGIYSDSSDKARAFAMKQGSYVMDAYEIVEKELMVKGKKLIEKSLTHCGYGVPK